MIGALLIATGLGACAWGLTTAARGERPASLGAALVAATGLAAALLGLARLLVPTLF